MKRIIALLLAAVMFSGAFALAEEPAPEPTPQEVFRDRLMDLLADFDPTDGDQAALSLSSSGQEVVSLLLRGAEELVDLTVDIPSGATGDVRVQFTPEEAYIAAAGSVMGLRYEDIPAVAQAASKAFINSMGISFDPDAVAAIDTEALQALFQLLAQTAIMKHVTMSAAGDGMILNYAATGGELIADLCEFVEQVLAEEKYRPLLEQIWAQVEASGDGSDLPGLDEVIALWPEAKESLLAVETEFSLALEARVNGGGEQIAVSADAGVPSQRFLLDFSMNTDPYKGKLAADVKLTERLLGEEEGETAPQDYDVQAKFGLTARDGGALWNLAVDYPRPMGRSGFFLNPGCRHFVLTMNGSHLDTVGRITMDMNTGRNSFDAEMNYELEEDGLSADAKVVDAMGKETALALDVAGNALKRFAFSQGYSREFAMRMLSPRMLSEAAFSVEYDGGQVTIVQGDLTIRCTGEFVSDHEYLITLAPEGEQIDDATPAYVRVGYEGEEGDWTLRGVVIDPDGSEFLSAALAVGPADPVESLAGAEGLTMLTPELAEQLIGMMLSH